MHRHSTVGRQRVAASCDPSEVKSPAVSAVRSLELDLPFSFLTLMACTHDAWPRRFHSRELAEHMASAMDLLALVRPLQKENEEADVRWYDHRPRTGTVDV